MRTFKPRYLVHGHVHLYDRNAAREARYRSTTIIIRTTTSSSTWRAPRE